MKNLQANYGQIIRSVRVKNGLTIGNLAALSGLTHPQISRIENEKSALTLNSAFRITRSLELPLGSLVSGEVVASMPLHFQTRVLSRGLAMEYSCLNSTDLDALDYLGFFSSGRAEAVIQELLELLVREISSSLSEENVKSVIHLIYSYLGAKKLPTSLSENLPAALPELIDFRYPRQLSLDSIRSNYFAGGVLIFLDIGAYVRKVRLSHGLSLKALGDTIGLSHQGVKQLELQTAEKIRLVDLLNLDMALDLQGELLDFSWKVAEFYAGVHRTKTKRSDSLEPFQSFEIHGIEKLIVVSRLFQHYFPDNREWLDEYRKQSNSGFSDWIR